MYKFVHGCTFMYMNVHEFRSSIRACLDAAARGEKVTIERGGLTFELTASNLYVTSNPKQEFNFLSENDPLKSVRIKPDIMYQPEKESGKVQPWQTSNEKPITNGSVVAAFASPINASAIPKNEHLESTKPTSINNLTNPTPFTSQANYCKNGHPIPDGYTKCLGKGCKYS